jgi:hypothetical protein
LFWECLVPGARAIVTRFDPDAGLKYGGTLPDQFMDSRHLAYPPFKPKPFSKLKDLCK